MPHSISMKDTPQRLPQISAFDELLSLMENSPAKKADEYTEKKQKGSKKIWGESSIVDTAAKSNRIKRKIGIPIAAPDIDDKISFLGFALSVFVRKRFVFDFFIQTSSLKEFITLIFYKKSEYAKK